MIKRESDDGVHIVCDGCGEDYGEGEYSNHEFDNLINDAKAANWQLSFTGGTWSHVCADCKETPLDRARRMLFQ